jgi:hypothetical protein
LSFALAVALTVWTAIVAVISLWALCEPIARPLVRAVLDRVSPSAQLRPLDPGPVSVLVLRPCAGRDADLEGNLRSLLDAGREGLSVRCVLAVGSASDEAFVAAKQAAEWLRAHEIETELALTEAVGPNHKVDQLARALAGRRASVVLVADSDVDLRGVDLAALVAPLRAGDAACWASVAERGASGALGDRASVAILAGGLHGFALLSRLDPAGMVGKLFAVRADALENVGGFSSMTRFLGEDVELSRRLRAEGYAVRARELGVFSSASGRTLGSARDRYARWMLVVRTQRGALMASYPLLFFAAPLQVLFAAALAPSRPLWALALALVAVSARVLVAIGARRAARLSLTARAALVDPWLGDAVLLSAWLRALTLREVCWRGGVLRFDRAGLLVQSP